MRLAAGALTSPNVASCDRFHVADEAIALTGHGFDVARFVHIIVQQLTEFRHTRIDGPCPNRVISTPDGIEQVLARD